MERTLDDYRQLFEVYLETGVLSEDTGDDCLAEYLKEVLDDPGNRHLCTTDPVWKDLFLTSLLDFFDKLMAVFIQMDNEKERN